MPSLFFIFPSPFPPFLISFSQPPPPSPQALFLGTRERSPDTAILLTSGADGYVYAWSIHHQGGLLGKFQAGNADGVAISSMSTDLQDQMLLTGDSAGYIMVGLGGWVRFSPSQLGSAQVQSSLS